MDLSAATPAIVILVYAFAEIMKVVLIKNDQKRTLLPALCILAGIVVSVLLFFFYPQGMPGSLMDAIFTGGISGIAATGCNQIWKQFQKFSNNTVTTDTPDSQEESNSDNS